MSKFTIKELAQMAGVSQTAVSFVLNGKPGVSDETRQRVLEIIEQTNYRSDRNSRRLAMRKSFNICLAYLSTSSPFDDLFYFSAAKGMIDEGSALGYNIVLNKIETHGGEYRLPEIITAKDADGVVIFQDVPQALIQTIENTYHLPCVVLDSYASDQDIVGVSTNATQCTYEAICYLLSRGHRKIGLIGSSYLPNYWVQVYNGYVSALVEQQLMINPIWVQNTACDEESAYRCTEAILHSGMLPTALFCASDLYAISAIACIKDHGLRVPEDISVMGVDNILLSKYCAPALTTVDYDKEALGRLALNLLVRRINGEEVESTTLPSSGIIERQSVQSIAVP